MEARIPEEYQALLKKFAFGRVTCQRRLRSPDDHPQFEEYFVPRLAGHNVRLSGEGPGYATQDEAKNAARRYRDLCRAALVNGCAP